MSDNGSPATHPVLDLQARSDTNGAPSPGTEHSVLRLRRSSRQAAHRFSMPHVGMPEVGVEEYRDTLEAVGRLAGKVAHHLNNLLTVVQGNAAYLEDALDEELDDGRFASEIREIRNACGRASEFTTQLLSMSGSRWYEPRVVDLRTLVADMDLGHFFPDDVVFCTDFTALACPVRVDPTHLQEVVMGLVLNAREAVAGHGTVRVAIDHLPGTKTDGSTSKGWVQLEVSDSGLGMDRETLSRVFHPFFSTRPFLEERGLGLSVACGIVRQSGGTMKISSAPGHGTTARVWLPAAALIEASERGPASALSLDD
jgi:two-component system, cell cycle sensor histidine kinase and response regulator CckA